MVAYIAADLLVRLVISLLSLTAMLGVGIWAFDAQPEGSMVNVLLAAGIGGLAFLAIGYALAALLPSQGVAQGVGNVLTYPLIILSGAAVPLAVMPDGAKDVGQFSPLTQLVLLLQGLWRGQAWSANWVALVALLATLVAATAIAARFFRWDAHG